MAARRWKYPAVLCLIAAASVVATALLGHTRFFQLVHLKAGDLQFLLRGTQPPRGIVLLVIDQATLDQFPEPLLFWHPYYAEAIQAARDAGARVFGFDVTFAVPVEEWAHGYDQQLAQAVIAASQRMPVICGYVPSTLARQGDRPVPLNMFAAALGQAAIANLRVDPDDFIRSLELIEAPDPSRSAPLARSLALRLAEKYWNTDAHVAGRALSLAGRPIPTSADRTITINYHGPAGTFPRVSLCDFIMAVRAGRKAQIREWVGGKAVLLGKDTIDDRHATPFYTLAPGVRQANTSGVEIHANALATLLDRNYLVPVPGAARWLALLAAAFITALSAGYLSASKATAALAAGLAVTIALTQGLFRSGRLLSASEMLLSGLVALVLALVWRSLTAEKRGAVFRKALALFVGRKLARTLDETEALPTSGSRQLVTILFSDIRGFTAFCEEKDPAVVVGLLNEYLRAMVAIIVRHHGHANKFIGDGIMAIFSDEDGSTPGDHATRALRCGLEMAQAGGPFRTGVGIHSGLALVGCVGSAEKMEFTALGDTVNLASRLEGLNKEHQTKLLLSEATRALLDSADATVCLGEVRVRGKSAPMNVYTLAGLAPARTRAAETAEKP